MKNLKGLKLGTLLLSGAVLLSACATDGNKETDTELETNQEESVESQEETVESVESSEETTEETKAENDDKVEESNSQAQHFNTKVDIKRASEIFYETFGDDTINITQIDFDKDDGKYTYEIEGYKDNTEYSLDIDAETEEILEKESETDDDIDKDDIVIDLDTIVTPDQAIEEALKQANATKVEGWDLDTEDGVLVYEIDVEDGEDVKISATDGSFIKFD